MRHNRTGWMTVLLAVIAVPAFLILVLGEQFGISLAAGSEAGLLMAVIPVFSTRSMLKALEIIKPARAWLRDTFFPNFEQSFTKYVDIDIYDGTRRVAPFVHPDLPGKLVERKGYTTSVIQPPYIKLLTKASANEVFENRQMGEALYNNANTSLMERARKLVAKDLIDFDDMITRREEVMASQILNTGKVTVVGEGYDGGASAFEIDYSQENTHLIELSGNDLWSDQTNSDPMKKLREIRRLIVKDSGHTGTVAAFSGTAWDAFIAHPKVQAELDRIRYNPGSVESRDLPEGVTYHGRLAGWDLYEYNDLYLDDWTNPSSPVESAFIPDKHVFFGATSTRNARHYGAIIDLDAATEQQGLQPYRIFPKMWPEKNPSALMALLQSAPLLVAHEVKSFVKLKVLA